MVSEKDKNEGVDEAIKDFETRLKRIDPRAYDHDISLAVGELYILKANYPNAILTFEALARDNPKVLYVWEHLARAAKAKGDYNYSIWAYEKKIENTCGNASFATKSISIGRILHEDKCSNCSRFMVRGILHRCKVCPFYNLCNDCFKTLPRPHLEHDFLSVPSAQWTAAHCPSERQSSVEKSESTGDILLGANRDSNTKASTDKPMTPEEAVLLQMVPAQM
jgi:hypothetical protein